MAESRIDKKQASRMREMGMTDAEIGRHFGVTRQAILCSLGPRYLDREVVRQMKEKTEKAKAAYRRLWSVKAVALEMGMAYGLVHRLLRGEIAGMKEERRKQMEWRLGAGHTLAEIAREFGMTVEGARLALRNAGSRKAKMVELRVMRAAKRAEAKALLDELGTVNAVAVRMGLSWQATARLLREWRREHEGQA